MKQAEKLKGWLPVRDGEWPLVLATGTFASLAVAFAIALRTCSTPSPRIAPGVCSKRKPDSPELAPSSDRA